MRLRLAEELYLPKELAGIRQIHSGDKSRIVGEVRAFLGLKPYEQRVRLEVEAWLESEIASEEGDPLALVNAAVRWFPMEVG